MKRVVIFSTAYAPHIGGAEIAIQELTKRLIDFEFVVVTAKITPGLPDTEMINGVKVVRVGNGSWFDKVRLWCEGYKTAEGKFDVVIGVMASYGGLAALKFKKKNPGVKFLLNLQEGDSLAHIYARAWPIWPWFKQIFTRADYVQAISNYLADWARQMGARGEITVIPNGVDLLPFSAPVNNSETKTVLSVSRLVEKNGVEYLIRAVPLLPKDVTVKIIGDGPLKAKLEQLIAELGVKEQVQMIGIVENHDLPKYYAAATVFVRPSLSEGLGISFLEAMEQGVPVIAPRVGGIPDFLQDGVTGWFCEARNPVSVAEKINYVLDSKNQAEVKLVKNQAQRLITEKYAWSVVAKQMQALLNKICAS